MFNFNFIFDGYNELKLYMREYAIPATLIKNVENCLNSVTKDLLNHLQNQILTVNKLNFIMESSPGPVFTNASGKRRVLSIQMAKTALGWPFFLKI
jgi:hypothetical protein